MAPVHTGEAMAPHSSTLAWKIPWIEEPGRLQSMGSWRVGHNWMTSLSLFAFMHRRRKWQPTPVFLPGESQGQRSLMGCCLWGRTESDITEADSFINTHVSFCFLILFPFRLFQNTEQSYLCYTVGPCWLSILNTEVCTCWSQTP